MAHQPRRKTCQGDFAASVKEILSILGASNAPWSADEKKLHEPGGSSRGRPRPAR